ncbi:MAG: hypothetical protein GC204_18140 [Chloroflexi bacterium]|nr:hypothetical protein [Chloroflexota bacterium]
MIPNFDLKRRFAPLYKASAKQAEIVDVPLLNFLMIDGSGDPNTAQAFADAVQALFSVAYGLRFMLKKERGIDAPVMPLEGLWWVDDLTKLDFADKSNWQWTLMIAQPEVVTETDVAQMTAQIKAKKQASPLLDALRLAAFDEGRSAQILHLGSFATEAPTIERLKQFMSAEGLEYNGKHHEIYLSDFRRAAPDKLKTIIRYPVRSKAGD